MASESIADEIIDMLPVMTPAVSLVAAPTTAHAIATRMARSSRGAVDSASSTGGMGSRGAGRPTPK